VIFYALMVLSAIKAEVAGPDLSEPVIRGLDLFCAKLHNKVRCGLGLCAAWTMGESARQAFQCSAKPTGAGTSTHCGPTTGPACGALLQHHASRNAIP
jgi:hypothetical protein